MKIVTVIGARPQFIKAAPVSSALRTFPSVTEVLVHTGQHYDPNMSEVFFTELDIPQPDYHLGIGSGSHGTQTGQMLAAIEMVLQTQQPDWMLVYGDTNSTLAGALAAIKLHIPVAHVEAGLRSFNRCMPEEINRIITDQIASLLFCPTETAVRNLEQEGFSNNSDSISSKNRTTCHLPPPQIHLVGDVMYDAALHFATKAGEGSGLLARLNVSTGNYVLATIHRAENTDDPVRLNAIITGLIEAARTLPVILPLHPRTRKILVQQNQLHEVARHLRIIEPVGYLDMVRLEQHAALIATDSGGVQKEAYFYQVPCVTLREETEWVELVTAGWNTLVSPRSPDAVAWTILQQLGSCGVKGTYYGDGTAAAKIVRVLAG